MAGLSFGTKVELISRARGSVSGARWEQGFTIVELLIVIIVIAILATISIVAYNGIQVSAGETVLKSDLANAARQLGIAQAEDGNYPSDDSALRKSKNTTFQYTRAGDDYCLTATSSRSGVRAFMISSDSTSPREGTCPGHTGPVSGGDEASASGVSTLAGAAGQYGYAEGTGSEARFDWPEGVDVDSAGNLYVADWGNGVVRKVTPDGVVSTFVTPTGRVRGIAVDSSGNVYTGSQNGCIQKFTATGVRSVLAGTCGTTGYADGTGAAARFSTVTGLALDASGDLYATDNSYGYSRIRKVTTGGAVTTFAGAGTVGTADGVGTAAQFQGATGLAVDGSGNIYVADSTNNCIRKISPSRVVSTFAGTCGAASAHADGTGAAARFSYPYDIDIDGSGMIYVADYSNRRIRAISPSGVVSTVAGTGAVGHVDGPAMSSQFSSDMRGIAVTPDGIIYISDSDNTVIRKIVQ